MNALSDAKTPLHVLASDPATEIFLVDARFKRLNKAVGEMRTLVAPGIYKLRFRSAQTQIDQLIEVPPDGAPLITAPLVPFVTAMPLDDTAYADPKHQQIVRETTASPAQRVLGSGSRFCLFARDPLDQEIERGWSGLSVHRLDGTPIADIDDVHPSQSASMAALSLELDPGTYRVRVSPANAPVHEIFVPLSRGWQTQLFTLSEVPSPSHLPRRPSLRDASISMAALGTAFEPADPSLRLAELLRYGLESGRSVLTDAALARVLNDPVTNLLLHIFVGHLLIRERSDAQSAVSKIVERAKNLVGDLPDVAALLLRPGIGTPPKALRFDKPPLLRSSWNLIVAATRRRMSLVPPDSLTAKVGEGLVTHPFWLMNGLVDSPPEKTRKLMSFAEATRLLTHLIRTQPDQLDAKRRYAIDQIMAEASPLERSLLNTTLLQPDPFEANAKVRRAYSVSKALKQIQAPNYSIARSVQRLKDKLEL